MFAIIETGGKQYRVQENDFVFVEKVEAKVAEGNKAEAEVTLKNASSLLDKAAQDGVISKNAAARKKSRLAKKVNAVE